MFAVVRVVQVVGTGAGREHLPGFVTYDHGVRTRADHARAQALGKQDAHAHRGVVPDLLAHRQAVAVVRDQVVDRRILSSMQTL
jgi:hypothetical protein